MGKSTHFLRKGATDDALEPGEGCTHVSCEPMDVGTFGALQTLEAQASVCLQGTGWGSGLMFKERTGLRTVSRICSLLA